MSRKTFYAHSTQESDRSDWQKLAVHLEAVSELAGRYGACFGAEAAARLTGLLHDLGKYTQEFQKRLDGAPEKTDHSTAGAWLVMDMASGSSMRDRRLAELVAYCIAGHHAGLPDRHGDRASLASRIAGAKPDRLDPVWRSEIFPAISGLIDPRLARDRNWAAFELAFLGRMIFSCLIDADRTDTARFEGQADGKPLEPDPPVLSDLLGRFIERFDAHMAAKAKSETPVNRLRGEILAHVRMGAAQSPGLFTLNVPTGGGKTLASLAFALDHARAHGHRRIIYAIPFTSIIDQTASVFRSVLGPEHILEHHSAIEEGKDFRGEHARDKLKLAMENWDKPIIVTTNVQLFESLFAGRTSPCRKLHNIAGSILVLDEAQTIPRHLLGPCVRALDVLARSYKCTIVLCTATQPALDASSFEAVKDKQSGKIRPHMLGLPLTGRELAPDQASLAQLRTRTRVSHTGVMSNCDLVTALEKEQQGLVIVNSRKHAYELFLEAGQAGLDGLMHLTTRQYAVHRRRILEDVRHRLAKGLPCRVIATSLIEAGVDVDFPRVWRAKAGLDQIAQAAGRCNREGRRDPEASVVSVFDAPDYPPPPEIRGLIGDMARMFDKHPDLLSPDAIRDYFREGYWRLGEDGLDKHKVLEKGFQLNGVETDFSYRKVGEDFRMIESGMTPVIVALEEMALSWVAKLTVKDVRSGALARALQGYVVQVPPQDRARLLAAGHVRFVAEDLRADQFAVMTDKDLYCEKIGLLWERADYLSAETLNV